MNDQHFSAVISDVPNASNTESLLPDHCFWVVILLGNERYFQDRNFSKIWAIFSKPI
jgi:hypothetical protein